MGKIITGALIGVALFGFAGFASASSINASAIFDEQTEAWGNPGDDLDITLRIEAEVGEVVHAIETDYIGDSRAPVCHDISNFQGNQQRDVSVDSTLPPNTDDYGFEVRVFTADNMNEANALKGNTACTGDNELDYDESDVVHVLPDGDSSDDDNGSGSSDNDEDSVLSVILAWIQAQMSGGSTPTPSSACAELQDKLLGTQDNVYNNANVMLQGFLLSEGMSIPALAAGASFGYKGPQTNAALQSWKASHQCI